MNEIIFFGQTLLIIGFALAALRLGKTALVAWVAIQALIANLFVLKQITLFGFDITASDAFVIGALVGLSLIQEYFSKEDAQKATWICFFFMIFFTVMSQVHLLFNPSHADVTQPAFVAILSHSPRLLMASMAVFFLVQRFDIVFFGFLKGALPNASFAVRTTLTLVVSQFLDTILFTFVGLYGIVASIFDVVFISFSVKLAVIFCSTSLLRWARA